MSSANSGNVSDVGNKMSFGSYPMSDESGATNESIEWIVINKDNPYKESVKGGNSTNDKIFLLSVEEVNKYFSQADMKSENSKLAAFATNYAKNVDNDGEKLWINYEKGAMYDGYSYYWLRSPGIYQRDAAGVDYDGKLDNDGRYVDIAVIGVRPAMWVSY